LTDALAGTGGAAACVRESLEGLTIHTDRMRTNLAVTGGLLLAEHVALLTGDREAVERAVNEGRPLADVLRESGLGDEEIERALDPARYLGAADELIDRALAAADEAPS
jgi:3-carboxy-cis,cis-muconate cycloisomerase